MCQSEQVVALPVFIPSNYHRSMSQVILFLFYWRVIGNVEKLCGLSMDTQVAIGSGGVLEMKTQGCLT